MRKKQPKEESGERSPVKVFELLLVVMSADNGCSFAAHASDFAKMEPHVRALQGAGYFADEPTSLNGSFWTCAAGEETEAKDYFSKAPEAYDGLSAVLNDIFNRPIGEELSQ